MREKTKCAKIKDLFNVNEIDKFEDAKFCEDDGYVLLDEIKELSINRDKDATSFLEKLRNYPNVLSNYIEFDADGDSIDTKEFIKDYGDYYITGFVPMYRGDSDEVSKLYYTIAKVHPDIDKDESEEKVSIKSTINGWVVNDHEYLSEDVDGVDYYGNSTGNIYGECDELIGIFATQDEAMDFIKTRHHKMSSIMEIKNGIPDNETYNVFSTDNNGSVEVVL